MRSTTFSLSLALGLASALSLVAPACGDDAKPAPADTASDAADGDADVGLDADADPDTADPGPLLHVPSPDWRDQVIYFAMIDRFQDGDPTNNDQGATEFDPSSAAHYSGGDLQGLIDRLDYLEALGVTAVWITPPVANQWWDPLAQFSGYHGYWGRHFKAVDEHYGTLATYQALSDALHRRGMYLIQDIVPNHTGNFFTWTGPYDPANVTTNFAANTGSRPTARPEQPPFDRNDPTDPGDLAAAVYHWTPAIADFTDAVQEKTWQISDLDDLNTENPAVRDALRDSYAYWIREVGVDGYRIDTVKFIDHDFWRDFIHGADPATPGVEAAAAATGRDDFLTFGEVYEVSAPFDDAGEKKCASYLGTTNAPELAAVLGFPLYEELKRVIGGGDPTSQLRYRLERAVDPGLFPEPHRTPLFIDNHDVQRFLAAAPPAAFRQALLTLFTLPGIPVVYQGTEQGFTETRASLFAGGWGSGGVDHFDTASAEFTSLASLIATRRVHPTLTRGDLTVLRDAPFGPGVLAFRRQLAGAPTALVLLNTAEVPILVADLQTDQPDGTKLELAATLEAATAPGHIGHDGRLLAELPPRGALLLFTTDERETLPAPAATITVSTPIAGKVFTADAPVSGTVTPASTALLMVIDDRLDNAVPVTVATDGSFTATLPISTFLYGDTPHTVSFYARAAGVASPRFAFTSSTSFDGEILTFTDPVDDDHGPSGTYTYPGDVTFAGGQLMDLTKLVVEAGAATLRLRFTLGALSTTWNPSNGFDHVAFTIAFDVPGTEGQAAMAAIQAPMPAGFAWDFVHFAFGWANAAYKPADPASTLWGDPVAGRPKISVDAATRTITFEYDAARFGLSDWRGVSVYATTWDFDGIDNVYRTLTPEGGPWGMGGGAATDPLVMDDLGPILIPLPVED